MDINREAPVIARADCVIEAPRELVWEVLTDLEGWVRWNTDVRKMDLQGPLAPETTFDWTAGGTAISSVIREVDPPQRIAWTGRTMGTRAVHVWTLEDRGSSTLVRTEESFAGLLPRILPGPMRRLLGRSLEAGLAMLKSECERARI